MGGGGGKELKGTRVSVPVFKIQLHVDYTELRGCVVECLKREGGSGG